MKVLLAPDSFKGALSAADAARAMADGWRRVFPETECVQLPVADGGEGTLAALTAATSGRLFTRTVTGPLGEPVEACWGLLGDGETAVVEMAEAAGLTLVPIERRDPKVTTTYGVGELILAAVREGGVRRVIVTLGGSATNDGGAGLLSALGCRFQNAAGDPLPPGGAALQYLETVDTASLLLDPAAIELLIACDVDNPLTGSRGASAIFGPQKGATPEDIALLDASLAQYAEVLGPPPCPLLIKEGELSDGNPEPAKEAEEEQDSDSPSLIRRGRGEVLRARGNPQEPGSGAAGGTAFGLLWLFPQAALRPGIDLVLDAINFDTHLEGADIVLTGEGRMDAQTLGGKAVAGVARRAQARGVPVGVLAGSLGEEVDGARMAEVLGVTATVALAPGPCTLEESMAHTAAWLAQAAERAARWTLIGQQLHR